MNAEDRRRICESKARFATEQAAQASNSGMKPYKCPVCKLWHLTSGLRGRLNKSRLHTFADSAIQWVERRERRERKKGRHDDCYKRKEQER